MYKSKIIVLQHVEHEDLENIEELFSRSRFEFTKIKLFKNQKIPKKLEIFSMMIVLGGPMDTWMEDDYPWLIEEKRKIKEFVVDLQKPFLGFCLGCQLLGEVAGGQVIKSSPPEIGILNIDLLKESQSDVLFHNFPSSIKALQWHSYEVVGLENNNDITLLGSSQTTKYQILKYKNHAYGIQFHIEIKSNTVSDWGCVPEYEKALEESLGPGALDKFDKLARDNMQDMNTHATVLYENFKKLIQ